ncbi:hypothetical protein ACQKLP_19370 [Chitinophaga sp. NPDC101104]|uniref:hypothetical protein n=1 Tax=Chitinophaga sp. NPDC101104 TaxID=3390561 RepID=UPI003D072A00
MMRFYITAGFVLFLSGSAVAQKGVNSLYSAFGIGDLDERDYSRNFGVGSAGIARPSGQFLNEQNPASYSALPMQMFYFEASMAGKSVSYQTAGNTQSAGDIGFKRFAIGFKAHERWGISAGLMPYSRIDYKLLNTTPIEGTSENVRNAIDGSGGLNRFYISNSVRITKNFSAGGSSAVIFGPVKTIDSLANDEVHTSQDVYYRNLNFTAGLQYQGRIGEWTIGAGATYRFGTTLNGSGTLSIRAADETILYQDKSVAASYKLPEQLGFGLTATSGNITWLADYKRQNWEGLNKSTTNFQYKNSERYAGGLEYTFKRLDFYGREAEGAVIQLGAAFHKNYISVKNQPLEDFSVSAGLSLPSRTGHLRYYLGLEGGQRGVSAKGLVQENYLNVVLHLSLRDNWFYKRKEM